jgi:hypothetical protein
MSKSRWPLIPWLVVAALLTVYQLVGLFTLPITPQLDVDYPLFGDQIDVSDEHFSACLLVMDDNHYLIEWLAYHYHSLPLRRLIIASDPRSRTSPTEILSRYQGLIDITIWQDSRFFPQLQRMAIMSDALNSNENKLLDLHRLRQRYFYASCMTQLHQENQTWTALVDSDEFITLNQNSLLHKSKNNKRYKKSTTILKALKTATFARDIPAYSACVSMPRLFFGTKESTSLEIQNLVPDGFDASNFLTFNRRYTPNPQDTKTNRAGKAMMDVSQVDPFELQAANVNIHVPLKSACGKDSLWIQNKNALFVVHHYVGTLEQWTFRQDPRKTTSNGTRSNTTISREQFHQQLAFDKNTDDSIRPWLQGLVDELGYNKTRQLLQGVGQLPPNLMEEEETQ